MDILHDVIRARPVGDYRVAVEFDCGKTGVFDCADYLSHPYWMKLKDHAFFNCVKAEYGTLTWPEDIDIAPEDVWEKCVFDKGATDKHE